MWQLCKLKLVLVYPTVTTSRQPPAGMAHRLLSSSSKMRLSRSTHSLVSSSTSCAISGLANHCCVLICRHTWGQSRSTVERHAWSMGSAYHGTGVYHLHCQPNDRCLLWHLAAHVCSHLLVGTFAHTCTDSFASCAIRPTSHAHAACKRPHCPSRTAPPSSHALILCCLPLDTRLTCMLMPLKTPAHTPPAPPPSHAC